MAVANSNEGKIGNLQYVEKQQIRTLKTISSRRNTH